MTGNLLIDVVATLLIAGVLFFIVRAIVDAFKLPAIITTVAGALLALFCVLYLLRLLPAIAGTA